MVKLWVQDVFPSARTSAITVQDSTQTKGQMLCLDMNLSAGVHQAKHIRRSVRDRPNAFFENLVWIGIGRPDVYFIATVSIDSWSNCKDPSLKGVFVDLIPDFCW